MSVDLEPEDMRAGLELAQAWACNYRRQPQELNYRLCLWELAMHMARPRTWVCVYELELKLGLQRLGLLHRSYLGPLELANKGGKNIPWRKDSLPNKWW